MQLKFRKKRVSFIKPQKKRVRFRLGGRSKMNDHFLGPLIGGRQVMLRGEESVLGGWFSA